MTHDESELARDKQTAAWIVAHRLDLRQKPGAHLMQLVEDALREERQRSASTIADLQRENAELREDRDRTARNRDMYKGQVERQAAQIEDFRSETNRLQVGVYVETLPAAHLIRVFADDMNERNWDDKRAYIKQQADRIRTALASTGGEHHAGK